MIRFFKNLFKGKEPSPFTEPDRVDAVNAAPYKIEAPAEATPIKCGCGRSQNGLCVGLHKLTPEEWSTHKDNPNATKPAAKKRTFKKREEGGTAKVAKIKAPAKSRSKAPPKPRTPK